MVLSSLLVAGLSHRTTPIQALEPYTLDRAELPMALREMQSAGTQQTVILSTCNRTEIYARCSDDEAVLRFFADRSGLTLEEIRSVVYVKRGEDAVRHLFHVSAGLDSNVLGESEILGQVKRAWLAAQDAGVTGPLLDGLFQRALAVGKRVRTKTALGKQALSVASLADKLGAGNRADLSEARVLVIGTGDMATRVLKELNTHRPGDLLIASRTPEAAANAARLYGGRPIPVSEIRSALPEIDVIFAATNAHSPILNKADILLGRRDRPLTIVDLGLPRNVSLDVRELDVVSCHDLEDVTRLSDAHRELREKEVPAAESIIDAESVDFAEWCGQRAVAPVIASMKDHAEEIRVNLLGWASGKLADISEDQRAVVDLLTQRLVKHFLRYPIAELRSSAGERDVVETISRLVGMTSVRPDFCAVTETAPQSSLRLAAGVEHKEAAA